MEPTQAPVDVRQAEERGLSKSRLFNFDNSTHMNCLSVYPSSVGEKRDMKLCIHKIPLVTCMCGSSCSIDNKVMVPEMADNLASPGHTG